MDAEAYVLALSKAKAYTDGVALHGVPINHPQIDSVTKHWKIFDPNTNSYYDTGYVAEGKNAPIPSIGANGNWYIGDQDTGRPAIARDVELGADGDYIRWRYVGSTSWHNIVPIDDLKAENGATPEFRVQGNVLQIRFPPETEFADLYTFLDAGSGSGDGYEPPAGGIPKGDLSPAVQGSLNKADTALQEEEDPAYQADKPTIALKTEVSAAVSGHNESSAAHADIREILNDLSGPPVWDSDTYTMTFTAQNGQVLAIDLPLEALAKDIDYDPATKEIVLTKQDDTEIRVSVSNLINEYTGLTNVHIQVKITNNEIEAVLLDGSIGEAKLSPALLSKINGKLDATAQAADSAKLGGQLPSAFAPASHANDSDKHIQPGEREQWGSGEGDSNAVTYITIPIATVSDTLAIVNSGSVSDGGLSKPGHWIYVQKTGKVVFMFAYITFVNNNVVVPAANWLIPNKQDLNSETGYINTGIRIPWDYRPRELPFYAVGGITAQSIIVTNGATIQDWFEVRIIAKEASARDGRIELLPKVNIPVGALNNTRGIIQATWIAREPQ